MVRPLRIQAPGTYHVFDRGTGPCTIFPTDRDCESLVLFLGRVLEEFRWACDWLCLMGTHYHLIVTTTDENLAAGMQRLKGLFAQAFNQRNTRTGALFQGRYGSIAVETEEYLLALVRYIAWNPPAAGLCGEPADWTWSSYAAIMRDEATFPFPVGDRVLELFAADRTEAIRRLRSFVDEGLRDPS